jgi:uracil-DNA glycosylase
MGVNPVVRASETAELLIVGQAPGRVVHQTSIPWNDKSGDNLRNWLDMDKDVFYDTSKIAIVPMGFCYPGTGKSGDLAPRPECAPLWHSSLLTRMPKLKLILLIGQYAQKYYLKEQAKPTLTETVKNFEAYLPNYFVLPHPSPRNNIWQAKNEWFAEEVIPILRETVQDILNKE